MAKLHFRYSTMNSGKSTMLLQTAHNYEERDMHVLVTKPAIDSKGNDMVVSRIGASRKVDFLTQLETNLRDEVTARALGNTACVLIDEAQFLQPNQVDQAFQIAVSDDIPVITYGLRTDFQTVGFPGASRLLEIAHDLQEIKTICRCGAKAVFNGRKQAGHYIFEGNQVAIDGMGDIEYESLCGACYYTARDGSL